MARARARRIEKYGEGFKATAVRKSPTPKAMLKPDPNVPGYLRKDLHYRRAAHVAELHRQHLELPPELLIEQRVPIVAIVVDARAAEEHGAAVARHIIRCTEPRLPRAEEDRAVGATSRDEVLEPTESVHDVHLDHVTTRSVRAEHRLVEIRELGAQRAGERIAQGLRCHVARRLGTLPDAQRLGLASLAGLDALGANQDGNVVVTVAGLVGAWVDTGDTTSALRLLRERELAGDLPEYAHYQALLHQRGRLHMALGDPAAALRDHLDCGHRMERRGARNPSLQPWRSHAALAHLALGERDQAARLAAQELELARDCGLAIPIGVALRVSGVVTGNAVVLEEAVSALRSTPARLELARALVDWGVALRTSGRGPEALAALRQGHDLAKRCAAIPLMGVAARELRAAGGRPAAQSSTEIIVPAASAPTFHAR